MKLYKNKPLSELLTEILIGWNSKLLFCAFVVMSFLQPAYAQQSDSLIHFSYDDPQKYTIEEITVSGINYVDKNQIVTISGLYKGDQITLPGDSKISQAIKRLWVQNFFGDVSIQISKVEGDKVWLNIVLTERSRVYKIEITGVKKGVKKDLMDAIGIRQGSPLSDYTLKTAVDKIKKHFAEKGFLYTEVEVSTKKDTTIKNAVNLSFHVDRRNKVKVKEITFEGNQEMKSSKLRKSMKKTKQKSLFKAFFKSKKFIQKNYDEDLDNLITFYNEKGYRDAEILWDSIYKINDKYVGIRMKLHEGNKYYFRNISWVGNTKYPTQELDYMLRIKKGDVYDMGTLEKRLNYDEQSVATVFYQDNGYIFSSLTPVEVYVGKDSIDVEVRVFEGDQATYSKINIAGNTKTNEHVIRRELRTVPGDLFSKSKYLESIRMLAQMGHFDGEELQKNAGSFVRPNPAEGTVDLDYMVTEKSNDQFELSGGWGANMFVGSVGIRFTNFSARRIFDLKSWRPVPSGDAQTLGLRFQTNGKRYQQFSINFMEPWLGGRKPISLNVSAYFSNQTTAYNPYYGYGGYGGGYGGYDYGYGSTNESMKVIGFNVGLGHRLKWPDHNFMLYYEVSLQRYLLNNWTGGFLFNTGNSNNFSFKIALMRRTIDQPLFTRTGSDLAFAVQLTPPYSLLSGRNYTGMKPSEKYKWIEYNKWTFKSSFFTPIIGDLILHSRVEWGYLGYYNKKWGYSPFEGFIVGGDGMSGYVMYGQDIVALRGYENNSLTPYRNNAYEGNVYNKYTLEVRYPVILQPQSTIYALSFLEAGNAWSSIDQFNPFDTKRSAGVGVRIFLPVVGMLGIDWGYGFDRVAGRAGANGSHFHFVIGQSF